MEWMTIPGMYILIGFVGAWALIVMAKIIMTKLLQRKETYYDRFTMEPVQTIGAPAHHHEEEEDEKA